MRRFRNSGPLQEAARDDNQKVFGLISPCGWGNLGDVAIQESLIAMIRAVHPKARLIGITLNPGDTKSRHGIEAFPMRRRGLRYLAEPVDEQAVPSAQAPALHFFERAKARIRSIPVAYRLARFSHAVLIAPLAELAAELRFVGASWSLVRTLDTLIIGGGGQLDEYWGGSMQQPYSLAKWALLARFVRVRVLVLSVGVGSLHARRSRWFVRLALKCAEYRSYRDARSRDAVGLQIGLPCPGQVVPDLAFGLKYSSLERPARRGTRKVVCLAPMAYFDPRAWPEKDEHIYNAYIAKLAKLVELLVDDGLTVSLFCTEVHMDRLSVEDVLKCLPRRMAQQLGDRVSYHPLEGLTDLLDCLAASDLVIASRLHALILASVSLKPVIALSYDWKVDVLMRDIDAVDRCISIREFVPVSVKNLASQSLSRQAELSARIETTVATFRRRLQEQQRVVFGGARSVQSARELDRDGTRAPKK